MDFTAWTAIQITILWSTSTVSVRSLRRSWTRVNIWKIISTIGGTAVICFSAECPGYYTIEKGGFYFQDYEIDTESLRQLGGSYLLSAAYIDHSEDTGLEPVRPEAFETEEQLLPHLSLSGNGKIMTKWRFLGRFVYDWTVKWDKMEKNPAGTSGSYIVPGVHG